MAPKQKKTKRSRGRKIVLCALFLLGMAILAYPTVSRLYYRVNSQDLISSFDQAAAELKREDLRERMALAEAYNDSLVNAAADPYAREKQEAGRQHYAQMLELHEQIGHVQIPRVDVDIPIYAGTAEIVLQKGAGHMEGTSLPIGGNSRHAVITAHSGLPTARLFSDLRKMELGDKFYVHNIDGILAYQVDQIKTIEPSDFSELYIVPGHDYVTLLTCTPIMINTHRLIVRGHRIEYVAAVAEQSIRENRASNQYRYLFYAAIALILLLFLLLASQRGKQKRLLKRLSAVEPAQTDSAAPVPSAKAGHPGRPMGAPPPQTERRAAAPPPQRPMRSPMPAPPAPTGLGRRPMPAPPALTGQGRRPMGAPPAPTEQGRRPMSAPPTPSGQGRRPMGAPPEASGQDRRPMPAPPVPTGQGRRPMSAPPEAIVMPAPAANSHESASAEAEIMSELRSERDPS